MSIDTEREEIFSRSKCVAAMEAILFAMGASVPVASLAAAIGMEEDYTRRLLEEMALSYEKEDRGIRIIALEDSWQMCTKPEHYPELIRIAKEPRRPVLTEVLLETLAIIAYRQPVTKGDIEKIRGVSSDHAVNRLVEYGLVEEAGRLNAPGRPILFATTEEFLRFFGMRSLSDLPALHDDDMERLTRQVEEELGIEKVRRENEEAAEEAEVLPPEEDLFDDEEDGLTPDDPITVEV